MSCMRRHFRSWIIPGLAGLLLPLHLLASEQRDDSALEELLVEAERTSLAAIRAELVRLEDRFYERFNQLNRQDDFDVHCSRETQAGTRLEKRYCLAVFEINALEQEGISHHLYLLACCDLSRPAGLPFAATATQAEPVFLTISARKPDFRRNMLAVTEENPELVAMLRERADAVQRYEDARRKAFGKKATSGDTGR